MDRTFTFYLAEVDSDGNVVRKIGELTSDWETVELVAKRKLRGVRAEFKGNSADSADVPADVAESA